MKTIYRRAVSLCLFLAVLFMIVGPAAAAAVNDSLRIRGPVYTGSDLTAILANPAYGDGTSIVMDATNFAAFFYDIDNVTDDKITGTFGFKGENTNIGNFTGEGTYNKITGTFDFKGTGTATGKLTGTYDKNTKIGTFTHYTDLFAVTERFTATYNATTNTVIIEGIGIGINEGTGLPIIDGIGEELGTAE